MRALRRSIRRGYAAALMVIASGALLAITMVSPVISTTTDFSIYNSGWNGTSQLAVALYTSGKFSPTMALRNTGTEITIANLGLEEIAPDYRTDAILIIGPTKPFTDSEASLAGAFVSAGGVLAIADDFGTGNTLLEGMGAKSRFTGKLVMDLAFEKRPEFSVCFSLEDDPLTDDVSQMLLNYPSSVTIDPSSTKVIASSSVASWLDLNGDRTLDWGEPRGPFTLVAREKMGNGSIILISDPSVLINGMRGQLDNSEFADNLLAEVGLLRAAVYIDESHRDYFDPLTIATRITGDVSPTAKTALLAIVFVLLLWTATDSIDRAISWFIAKVMRAWRALVGLVLREKPKAPAPPVKGFDELVAELTELHPDWKPGLVRYVLREKDRHLRRMSQERKEQLLADGSGISSPPAQSLTEQP